MRVFLWTKLGENVGKWVVTPDERVESMKGKKMRCYWKGESNAVRERRTRQKSVENG